MDSISKIMIIVCWLLVLALQLKCSGAIPIIPSKVTVEIINELNMLYLVLRCKDKHKDLGFITLNVNETYRFRFYPNYFLPVTLYFCRFIWLDGDYYFNIYEEKRDGYCIHDRCLWEILENGPCKIKREYRQCFMWDKALAGKNNTVSS